MTLGAWELLAPGLRARNRSALHDSFHPLVPIHLLSSLFPTTANSTHPRPLLLIRREQSRAWKCRAPKIREAILSMAEAPPCSGSLSSGRLSGWGRGGSGWSASLASLAESPPVRRRPSLLSKLSAAAAVRTRSFQCLLESCLDKVRSPEAGGDVGSWLILAHSPTPTPAYTMSRSFSTDGCLAAKARHKVPSPPTLAAALSYFSIVRFSIKLTPLPF